MAKGSGLPRVVCLPFGYRIKVKQVTRKELNLRVGEDCVAGWIAGDRTIYLVRSRTLGQKRADLVHELGHVLVDFAEMYRC